MTKLTKRELNTIRYKHINTKEKYDLLYKTGFFFEFHPELTGSWGKDRPIISGEWDSVAVFNPESIPECENHKKINSASKMRDVAYSYNMQFNLDFILDEILKNAKGGKYELLIDHPLCAEISTALSELGYDLEFGYDLDCLDSRAKISWY